jgi:hypothetical protein
MTVESTDRRTECPGNDSGTVFSSVFAVQAAAHLSVTHVATDGTETDLVLDTDYEVALAETGVAAITFPKGGSGWSTLATGETLVIVRDVPLTQELDLQNYGEFNVELVERALDRAAMVDQQLQEQIDRCVRYPVSSDPEEVDTSTASFTAAVVASQAAQAAAELAQAAAEIAQAAAEAAAAIITIPLPVSSGGTGASTPAAGLLALGGTPNGRVIMIRTANSSNDVSTRAGWKVYGPAADDPDSWAEVDITGTTTEGLQEAIDHAQRYGYDFKVYGGGYQPMVWGVDYGGNLANDPLTTTNGSAVVVVALAGHGLTTGQQVTLAGLATTNGVPDTELNARHEIAVVDVNSFSITATTPATSSGTGGGASGTYQHYGQDVSIIYCSSPVAFTPLEKMSVDLGSVSLIFAPSVTDNGLTFDTGLMVDFNCGGQIGYAGDGAAVAFKPSGNLPLSFPNQYAIVDGRYRFNAIALYGTPGAGASAVLFDCTDGPITGNHFQFAELNGGTYGIRIEAAAHGFAGNIIQATDVHSSATYAVALGTDSDGALIVGNIIAATCDPDASGGGLLCYGVDNVIDIDVSDDEGTPSIGIRLESTAKRNVIRAARLEATAQLQDASDGSNLVQYNNDEVSVRQTSAQTLSTGTWTKVTLGTEIRDTAGTFASDKWTPGFIGPVVIAAAVSFASPVDAVHGAVAIYKNGASLKENNVSFSGTNNPQSAHISVVDRVTATTDYYELYAIQRTGGDLNTYSGAINTWFTGRRF